MNLEEQAQEAAEEHLAACYEALWDEDEYGKMGMSPAVGPFCGCDTCVVREVLWAAWQHLIALRDEQQEPSDMGANVLSAAGAPDPACEAG